MNKLIKKNQQKNVVKNKIIMYFNFDYQNPNYEECRESKIRGLVDRIGEVYANY